MKLALIADVFPPLRSSGAVQLRDLAREFVRQGHELFVLVPDSNVPNHSISTQDGYTLVRLNAPVTKDVGYVRRTLGEFMMPYFMRRNFSKSAMGNVRFDGVIWYSPTIFLGPLVAWVRRKSRCRSYLIVRDIFPEWAVDMGLMKRGPAYWLFNAVAKYQYSVADVIGVQTPGNLSFFAERPTNDSRRVEVLHNWLTPPRDMGCTIDVQRTPLAGRRIFVYAGNMGVAQGMDALLDLAELSKPNRHIGFLLVGRGSETSRLKQAAADRQLDNVIFSDEIEPDEIGGLYAQCDVGLLALDPRHRTHNIPGKFLSYMHCGLPVLAIVNRGNDLVQIIETARVGQVLTDASMDALAAIATEMANTDFADVRTSQRCKALADSLFATDVAVKQISTALQN